MDIVDEIVDKFILDLDSSLSNDSRYNQAFAKLNEFAERELSDEKAAELRELAGVLTTAVFNTASKAGVKLGAKIAAGLLKE